MTTCAMSMRTASPSERVPPLGIRRPLTRTAPSSIARFTRARLSSGRSCAIPLSRRAPWSAAGTTKARTAFGESPGGGDSASFIAAGTIVITRTRPSPLMVRPAGSLVESGRAIGRIRARALPHEAISSVISAAGLHARPVLRFLLRRDWRRACPRAHAPAVEGNQTNPMKIVELVDDLYEAFADRLGQVLSA